MKYLNKAFHDGANERYSRFKSSQTLVEHSEWSGCPSGQTDENVGKLHQIIHEDR
jgi:hypothetical protein